MREQDILEAAIEVGYQEEAVLEEMRATTRNKTTQYAAIVIAVVLSLSAVALIHYQQVGIAQQAQPTNPQSTTPQPDEQEDVLQEALTNNDPERCEELRGELREECEELLRPQETQPLSEQDEILNQALTQNNPALCAQLDEELRAECEAILQ